MRVTTLRTYKLIELVNPRDIHSVVIVTSSLGSSICVAIKEGADNDIQYTLHLRSYEPGIGTVIYIPMSNRYTYHYPSGIAIPVQDYKYIKIRLCETEWHQKFAKGHITRRLSDWATL